MPKNYYVILGIPATSSLGDIKSAYRKLAKEYHPDRYKRDQNSFLAIQEAYSVLSDPTQRREYDNSLGDIRMESRQRGVGMAKTDYQGENIEPLIPESRGFDSFERHSSYPPRSPGSWVDSVFSQFLDNASPKWNHRKSHGQQQEMEIYLTVEQARKGGHVRLFLPTQIYCPDCDGRGEAGVYECWNCFGSGMLQAEIPVLLNYPPGISDGHLIELQLSRRGMGGATFKVKFSLVD